MKTKWMWLAALLASTTVNVALAGPGPKEACEALSERAREAAGLKTQGEPVAKAVATLASQAVPDSVPGEQHGFYTSKLPGAARFAFMAGMSGDAVAQFYLKQCLKGS